MEESVKKSVALAGRPSIAVKFCRRPTVKVVKPTMRAKLLGVDFVAGRKRSTKVTTARLKNFAKRISRVQALRKSGVKVVTMARTAATSSLSYGLDIMGMADSTLDTARSQACRAATPSTKGRSVDIALWAMDGPGGTMDTAFDASLLGLRHWCMA